MEFTTLDYYVTNNRTKSVEKVHTFVCGVVSVVGVQV
jgi:hypothetical protein